MSSEQGKNDNDKLVADTYRSLATEQTPEHLNQRVLRMAAGAGPTRFSLRRAWIRPMAWAATIGLSLAIVLEITSLPQTQPSDAVGITATGGERRDPAAADIAAAQPSAVRPASGESASRETDSARQMPGALQDEFEPQRMEMLRKAEGMARTQAGPQQQANDARADILTTGDEFAAAEKRSAQTESETSAPVESVASEAARPNMATAPDEIDPTEQRAPQPASRTTAPDKAIELEAARAAPASFASTKSRSTVVEPPCPDPVRESAAAWLGCIAELLERGRHDLAETELVEFRKKYPDLAEIDADK